MKNIILYQPKIGDMDTMRSKPSLPLSLLHCASVVTEYCRVKIIDQRITKNWKETLRNHITDETIYAGVTSFTGYMIKGGLEFSKYVKDNWNIPVVWGGIHASLLPEQTLANEYIDIVVQGEGELTLNELTRSFKDGIPLSEVSGICYKSNGKPKKNVHRNFADMDKLPNIPYHLVNIDDYLPTYKGRRSIYFQSSRGCPFKCTYCYNSVFNRGCWRSITAEKTLDRIRKLVSVYKNIDDIYFVDDNFFINLKRARKIAEGFREMDISWQVQGVDIISLKRMDSSFFELLQKSNCLRLTVGIESGSKRIRRLMGKEGELSDIMAVTGKLKRYDLVVYCSFLIGFPTETIEDIKKSVSLLMKMLKTNKNIRNSPFYVYTPYPGTPMYKLIEDEGYKMPKTLEEWAKCEWDQVTYRGNKNFLNSIYFASLFLDYKTREYNVPYILKILVGMYRPVARFRMKRLYFRFMLEKWFFDILKKTWYKTRLLIE